MTSMDIQGNAQIPEYLCEVGPGWRPLLLRLHDRLAELAADYRVESISPRLGGLRIRLADRFDSTGEFDGAWADAAARATDAAEAEAERTCEACGEPGQVRFHRDARGTWIRTLCTPCAQAPTPGTA
jgi:hypothetical protein